MAAAEAIPSDDVVAILLQQHEQITGLFSAVLTGAAGERQARFDELRSLLAVHETGEEMVLRPVTEKTAGAAVTDARNTEEKRAAEMLDELEMLDVGSDEFLTKLRLLQADVIAHASKEEQTEFPTLQQQRDPAARAQLGRRLRAVERVAPTHPHPTAAGSPAAQAVLGPFAAMVDRVRDAFARTGADDR